MSAQPLTALRRRVQGAMDQSLLQHADLIEKDATLPLESVVDRIFELAEALQSEGARRSQELENEQGVQPGGAQEWGAGDTGAQGADAQGGADDGDADGGDGDGQYDADSQDGDTQGAAFF